jgi:hypothetical protein
LATSALRPWRFWGAPGVPPTDEGVGVAYALEVELEDELLCEDDEEDDEEEEDEEVDDEEEEEDVLVFVDEVVWEVQGEGSTHFEVVVGGGGVQVLVGLGFGGAGAGDGAPPSS